MDKNSRVTAENDSVTIDAQVFSHLTDGAVSDIVFGSNIHPCDVGSD